MNLLEKYNIPGPRYTSYPTVPFWNNNISESSWKQSILESYTDEDGLSLYLHLPYCETFCTYCACNKVITQNHSLEAKYVAAILKEWRMYKQLFVNKPVLKQLHLGGGTPTFFSAENLEKIVGTILSDVKRDLSAELSVEIHPNVVSEEQIETFKKLGFNRFSLGIQDFDIKVQTAINRFQTVGKVEEVLSWIRTIDGVSVNFDLIYGLPFQTMASIENTFAAVVNFRPDRISFYSYAHVPWKKNAQRLFTEDDLPTGIDKLKLYERGKELLSHEGYETIGMDHFSLPTDELHIALEKGNLNRNFMGYTVTKSSTLIGLGVSSISETEGMYVQNEKSIKVYYDLLAENKLPIVNGHLQSHEDKIIKKHVMNLMCQFETTWPLDGDEKVLVKQFSEKRFEMLKDELLQEGDGHITVADSGRSFVRNICMTLDPYLLNANPEKKMFSQTV